jgi:hypothetical protein
MTYLADAREFPLSFEFLYVFQDTTLIRALHAKSAQLNIGEHCCRSWQRNTYTSKQDKCDV